MRTLQNEFGQIGNDIGLAHSDPSLQTFDPSQPLTAGRAGLEVMSGRRDLHSRGLAVEFGREDFADPRTSIGHGTKVPKIVRHAE